MWGDGYTGGTAIVHRLLAVVVVLGLVLGSSGSATATDVTVAAEPTRSVSGVDPVDQSTSQLVCSLDAPAAAAIFATHPSGATHLDMLGTGAQTQEYPCDALQAAVDAQNAYTRQLAAELRDLRSEKADFVREYVERCIEAGGGGITCPVEANEAAGATFDSQIGALQATFDAEIDYTLNVLIPEMRACYAAERTSQPFELSLDLTPRNPDALEGTPIEPGDPTDEGTTVDEQLTVAPGAEPDDSRPAEPLTPEQPVTAEPAADVSDGTELRNYEWWMGPLGALSAAGDIGTGIGEGFVTDLVSTVEAMGNVVFHPIDSVRAIGSSIGDAWNEGGGGFDGAINVANLFNPVAGIADGYTEAQTAFNEGNWGDVGKSLYKMGSGVVNTALLAAGGAGAAKAGLNSVRRGSLRTLSRNLRHRVPTKTGRPRLGTSHSSRTPSKPTSSTTDIDVDGAKLKMDGPSRPAGPRPTPEPKGDLRPRNTSLEKEYRDAVREVGDLYEKTVGDSSQSTSDGTRSPRTPGEEGGADDTDGPDTSSDDTDGPDVDPDDEPDVRIRIEKHRYLDTTETDGDR